MMIRPINLELQVMCWEKQNTSKHTKKFKQMFGDESILEFRKERTKNKSDKHSDLYTDENVEGTIHG